MAIATNMLTLDQLVDAEEQHVKSMIVAVVARTNKFRVAMALIWIEVVIMVAALVFGGLIVARAVGSPPTDVDVKRLEQIKPPRSQAPWANASTGFQIYSSTRVAGFGLQTKTSNLRLETSTRGFALIRPGA